MTPASKTSSCVDCATTIIGERLRCPACHDRHASGLLAGDEDVTLPRDRSRRRPSSGKILMMAIGAAQVVVIVTVLTIVAGGKC